MAVLTELHECKRISQDPSVVSQKLAILTSGGRQDCGGRLGVLPVRHLLGWRSRIGILVPFCWVLIFFLALFWGCGQRTKEPEKKGPSLARRAAQGEPDDQTFTKSEEESAQSLEAPPTRASHSQAQQDLPTSGDGLTGKDIKLGGEVSYTDAVEQAAPDRHGEGLQDPSEQSRNRLEDLTKLIAEFDSPDRSATAQQVLDLWVLAADTDVPEEALEVLDHLAYYEPDEVVANQARRAAADLRHLRDEADTAPVASNSNETPEEPFEPNQEDCSTDISSMDNADGREPEPSLVQRLDTTPEELSEADQKDYSTEITSVDNPDGSITDTSQGLIENTDVQEVIDGVELAALEEQAMWDSSHVKRHEAIHTLSLYRSEATVNVLIQAGMDQDPVNRYKALEALWCSAADGLDNDNSIRVSLEQALADSDEGIVEFAGKALTDLDRLEAARQEAETAMPSTDDYGMDPIIFNPDGSLRTEE